MSEPKGDVACEAGDGTKTRFAPVVVLSKREVFEVCEACAAAERALMRKRLPVEAAALAAVFELLEGRLVVQDREPRGQDPPSSPFSFSGSKSSESELTQ